MLRWWHALIVHIIPFSSTNASYFGGTIASPMVVAEPRESSIKPSAAASTRRRDRPRRQHHTDDTKSSNPEAQARVVSPKASRDGWRIQQQRRGWSVVASVEGAFKSALRDISYCVAGLASAGQGQYNFMRNRLAFGNVLKPVHSNRHAGNIEPQALTLQAQNDASVDAVMEVIASDGWEHVTKKFGITVVKKFLSAPDSVSAVAAAAASSPEGESVVDPHKAAKFACVKAVGTLDADAFELYKLFLDNERVHEYNESCQQVRDLERLSPDTKVSWAATPRYGPFKARDFVTVVHYRTLADGTMVVLNRAVEHSAARHGSKYVRAEILIATNLMRPNRADPTKTDFISVTHINPGGIVDSAVGAKIANMLCAKAPVNLLVSLERCANSPAVPKINERPGGRI